MYTNCGFVFFFMFVFFFVVLFVFFFFKQKTAYEISACLVGSEMCIRDRAYMGPQYEVTVDWHGQSMLLQINATQLQPSVGDSLFLQIHPYGMFILPEEQ